MENQVQREERRIGDFDEPISNGTRMGIRPPPCTVNDWEIKASFINMVQRNGFSGLVNEHPIEHLENFDRLCGTIKMIGVPEDVIKLTLFPFSLGDKASQWEKSVVTSSITTWEECKKRFLFKFFPTHKTVKIRNDIATFKQWGNESLYEAWERINGYTRACPHHGISREAVLSFFHRGIHRDYQLALNTASNGNFANLTITQGEKLIENLTQSEQAGNVDYDQRYNELRDLITTMIQGRKEPIHVIGSQKEFYGGLDFKQEGYGENNYIQDQRKGGYHHRPLNQEYNNSNHSPHRNNNVENPSDQGYHQHQNYQAPYTSNQQPLWDKVVQAPPPSWLEENTNLLKRVLEGQEKLTTVLNEKIEEIHKKIDGVYDELNAKFEHLSNHVKTLDVQMEQFATSSQPQKGKEFCQAIANPKGYCNMILGVKEKGEVVEVDEVESDLERKYEPKIPFPPPVYTKAQKKVLSKFKGDLCKSGIILPFANDLTQVPTYIRFIKNILQQKEKVEEILDGIESTSCAKEQRSLLKSEDAGGFFITCTLGGLEFNDALVDSGASANVMSKEIMDKLGITTMKPNSTLLTFGNSSSSYPLGMIGDYPLKIGDCLIPTDFMIMEGVKDQTLPLILGRPFLTTTGASIDFSSKRVILHNVDNKVSYSIDSSPTKFCGTIIKSNDVEELKMLSYGEEEVKKLVDPKLEFKKGVEGKVKEMLKENSQIDVPKEEPHEVLDDDSLNYLFAMNLEEEEESHTPISNSTTMKKTEKEEKNIRPKLKNPTLSPMFLTPTRCHEGVIEYKIICKGSPKPFASLKATISKEMKEDNGILKEFMKKTLTLEIKDHGTCIGLPPELHSLSSGHPRSPSAPTRPPIPMNNY